MGRVVTCIKWCAGTDSEKLLFSSCVWVHAGKEVGSHCRLGVMVPEAFMSTLDSNTVNLGIPQAREH